MTQQETDGMTNPPPAYESENGMSVADDLRAARGLPPRLTDAQRSFLKRLYLVGGHDRLHTASFATATALHDKGMVVITVIDSVNGRVAITEAGEHVARAICKLLNSPDIAISAAESTQP